ncbi:hypothetical protein CMU26_01025 [Elizabethkingia anophelis]|nr:hypothetical protein [Elizabethkingia anophelis]
METPKQQAIKAAYGEHWDKVKDYVDEDGWCNAFFGIAARDFDDTESKREVWRPKSLSGIETNNSWTRIESEEDMPKEPGHYFVMDIFRTEPCIIVFEETLKKNWLEVVSHYQPIETPKPPIF